MIYDLSNYTYEGYIVPMEFWKRITNEMIPGIKPIYWISSIGNIYNEETGKCFNRASMAPNRYIRVSLKSITGGVIYESVHRLVCMAFNGLPTDERPIVDHLNNDRTCSYEGNLEWVNYSENNSRAVERGRQHIGEDNYRAILTNDDVREICIMLSDSVPIKEIERIISERIKPRACSDLHSIIHSILHRESWRSISKDYEFPSYDRRKFSLEEVETICRLLELNYSYDDILKTLGYIDIDKYTAERLKSSISFIRHGHHYPEISSKYNISKEIKHTLSDEEADIICNCYIDGISRDDALQKINRPLTKAIKAAVFDIYRGQTYKNKIKEIKMIKEGSTTIEKDM